MIELRIDVADLLRQPGGHRRVQLSAVVDDLAGRCARVEGPVAIDVTLERVAEGIVVRGDVRATWTAECGICLRPVEATFVVHVAELFEVTATEGDTYPIEGHEIDLEQLVRDTVLLELPLAPVCTGAEGDACAARRAQLHVDDDAHDPPSGDPRWGPLSKLDL